MKKIINLVLICWLLLGVVPNVEATTYSYTTIDFPGATLTGVIDINNTGKIVGLYKDASGGPPPWSGLPTSGWHGFLHDGTTYTSIDYPGALWTIANGINNAGIIVGVYMDSNGNGHGFLYDGTSYSTFDRPGFSWSGIFDINNVGNIVGWTSDASGQHGYLYDGTTFTTIDYPGAISTGTYRINDTGNIVGWYVDASGNNHGFLYDGATYTTIEPPGSTFTHAYGINNAGDIVGSYEDITGGHGFLYDGTTYHILDYPGATGTGTESINDFGTIVGGYGDTSGDSHGYVATVIIIVTIDIKPGSFPNSINLKSKGNVPVAILSSPTFDATTVDQSTAVFINASPLSIGKTPKDVNGDGLLDVVLHFKTQDLDLQTGDAEACLTGEMYDGQIFKGCDSVRIIK